MICHMKQEGGTAQYDIEFNLNVLIIKLLHRVIPSVDLYLLV